VPREPPPHARIAALIARKATQMPAARSLIIALTHRLE
jgi:hypothetical protein